MLRAFALGSAFAAAALAQSPGATFVPCRLFGDHMVLPAASKVPCWGRGVPGAAVEVTASWGETRQAVVDADGRWRCELPTVARGGPHTLTLRCGAVEHRCDDVLLGDVWLGSGQSNMEMPVAPSDDWGGVRDWQQEVAAADLPQLRWFTVRRATAARALDDVEGEWVVCSPATAGAMSATAFFFGRELLRAGEGPLGVVVSCWGGTVAEAWTSPAGLAEFPEFEPALRALQQDAGSSARAERVAAFWRAVDAAAAAGPVVATVPERWSRGDLAGFDGVATYSRTVELPAAFVGQELELELGAIDDMDTVTWNGERIGGMQDDGAWSTPRRYRVPAAANTAAVARVVVRVVDTGGEGGFAAAPESMRVGLVAGAAPAVPLAGAWQRARGPAMHELPPWPRQGGEPNRPTVLFQAMIAPLLPFPFTGVIWYQGESNRERPQQYARLFPALVQDWRRGFGRALPFYGVQIAPFAYRGGDGDDTARLRLAQAAVLGLEHTGLAITLDVGDAEDIHPAQKQQVGERLARLALARHYGKKVACDGPLLGGISMRGAEVRLHFTMATGGLVLERDGAGFELAGKDGHFVAATARLDGDLVVVHADAVAAPVAVRYAWGSAPAWSLRNGAGLPAPPFERVIP